MQTTAHVAHIYETPADMAHVVSEWLALPLRSGGASVLICTPEHASLVLSGLAAAGIDVERALREGELIILDARATLARFMRSGAPDAGLFRSAIGEALTALPIGRGAPVRAWGEMVDILSKEGQPASAYALEGLWNDLIREEGIQLLCSYEIQHASATAQARSIMDICERHTDVFGEEGRELDAVHAAIDELVDPREAPMHKTLRPERVWLLERASEGAAILATLRERDAELGARVASRARAHRAWPEK